MIFPTRDIFIELSRRGNLIPVYKELVADLETPVSAYLKLDTGEHTFLLESAEKGERFGRYSFVGSDPRVIFTARGRDIRIEEGGKVRTFTTEKDPLHELEAHMARYRPIAFSELPIFYGGAVGFLTYEMVRFFEPTVPLARKNDLNLPDAYFVVSDSLVIFDHLTRKMKLLVNAFVEGDAGAAYDAAVARIAQLEAALQRPVSAPALVPLAELPRVEPSVNMTQDEYVRMTEAMQEYIRAGDIFQVVPSQRFTVPYDGDPIVLYRALRHVNPSPYMFCLKFGGIALVGSSPETHVRCENGMAEIHPIAGTRPRKPRREDDDAMEKELLADPKERAEHVMIVDLERNDLGRVCEPGTIAVDPIFEVVATPYCHQMVSTVTGTLLEDTTLSELLESVFPCGSVTGAPKIAAMKAIAAQEASPRAAYTGSLTIAVPGQVDSSILIRTAEYTDGLVRWGTGGGITVDSDPHEEWLETVLKASPFLASPQ
jgi:anthranilate synthase component 1